MEEMGVMIMMVYGAIAGLIGGLILGSLFSYFS